MRIYLYKFIYLYKLIAAPRACHAFVAGRAAIAHRGHDLAPACLEKPIGHASRAPRRPARCRRA